MMQLLLAILVGTLFDLLALRLVRSLVSLWILMYTMAVPEELRTSKREEMRSELHDHESDMRQEGYRPSAIALDILYRMIRGLWNDVAWSVSHLPSTLSNRLSRGSDAVSRARPSTFVIALLATFGLMNLGLYATEPATSWFMWAGVNVLIPVVVWAALNQERRWVRRIIQLWMLLAVISVVSLMLWVVLDTRLYQKPTFYPTMLQAILAMALMSAAIGVASTPVRNHLFKGRWRPVLVTWVVLGGACLAAGVIVGENLAGFVGMLLVLAVMYVLALCLVVTVFGLGAMAVCFVAVKGTAGCMRLAAVGIRRLERKS